MATGEEVIDVGLGVPVFVSVTGVTEEAVVAETFKIAVLQVYYAIKCLPVSVYEVRLRLPQLSLLPYLGINLAPNGGSFATAEAIPFNF